MENNLNKSKIIMKNFRYYYLKNEIKSERDSIGLGRLFTNTQYSFTHQMFLNHIRQERKQNLKSIRMLCVL